MAKFLPPREKFISRMEEGARVGLEGNRGHLKNWCPPKVRVPELFQIFIYKSFRVSLSIGLNRGLGMAEHLAVYIGVAFMADAHKVAIVKH